MLNHIAIMGRLTRDPELRHTQDQKPVCSFTIACDRDRQKENFQNVDFVDCVAWNNTAEMISKWFHKGSMIVVCGRLQIRDWSDKDGNKRKTAEIVCSSVYFGEPKRPEGHVGAKPFAEIGDEDGELPF